MLYASSQKLGCFLETLARFRLDPKLMAELGEIDRDDDHFPLGEVPVEWIRKRILGGATAAGEYADICSSEWISRLRRALAGHLERFGLDDIDASALQKTAPRILTQLVSRIVFYAGFSGIYYLLEGKFASEGLQAILDDDDMLTAMTRELVQNKGIGESADSVWRSLGALRPSSTWHMEEEPVGSPTDRDLALTDAPPLTFGNLSNSALVEPVSPQLRSRRAQPVGQLSLF